MLSRAKRRRVPKKKKMSKNGKALVEAKNRKKRCDTRLKNENTDQNEGTFDYTLVCVHVVPSTCAFEFVLPSRYMRICTIHYITLRRNKKEKKNLFFSLF
jgi:hypothetical protein